MTIATHAEPVLRADADFLIHVDLTEFGMTGRLEQLWTKNLGDNHFQVCCLPFFTYGVALGDVVVATLDEKEQYTFRGVFRKSGHRLLRFAFRSKERAIEVHEELHRRLLEAGARHEWHGSGYGAVDIAEEHEEYVVRTVLQAIAGSDGVSVEVE